MPVTAAAVLEVFSLFEGSAIGISLADAHGRILRANDRYAAITGYTREELQWITFVAFTHPDDLPDNLALARRMNKGEISRAVFEKRYIRKSGEVCWVRNSIAIIREEKGSAHALTLSEDISDQRVVEREVLRTRNVLDRLSKCIALIPSLETVLESKGDGDDTLAGLRGLTEDGASTVFESTLARDLRRFTHSTGVLVTLNVQAGVGGLPHPVTAAALRVINMLLKHVHSFSGAAGAVVSVVRTGSELTVEVSDIGRGSRPSIVSKTKVEALQERVSELGGWFELRSNGSGAVRRAVLPLG